MRTKKFIYNTISSAITQFITLIIGLILPRLFISTYGSEANGLISSVTQFVSYFALLEAGLAASLVYSLYKPIANNDFEEINSIVSTGKKYYNKIAALYFLLVIVLSVIYPFIAKRETIDITTTILLVLVVGASGAINFSTMAKFRVLLSADQKTYIIALVNVVTIIINFIIVFILIKLKINFVVVKFASLFPYFLRSIFLNLYIKKYYKKVKYNLPVNKIYLNKRFDALIVQIANTLNLSIPIVLITIICSLKEVSVFAVYNMVFAGIVGLLSIVTSGLSASFGDIITKNETSILKKSYREYEFVLYLTISILYACSMILIMPFIALYTKGINDINYSNLLYGILFCVWGVAFSAKLPHGTIIVAAGIFKETRRVNILQIVLLTVLTTSLGLLFKVVGILIGMSIASLYRSIDFMFVTEKYVKNSTAKSSIIRLLITVFAIIVSVSPFFTIISLKINSLFQFFITGFIVFIWCSAVALIINVIFYKKDLLLVLSHLKSLKRKVYLK